MILVRLSVLIVATASLVTAAEPEFDILIRHGTVVDGTGTPGSKADIGIRDGRIVAVGNLDQARGLQDLDAAGCVVCPGFVDLHTHADEAILKFRSAENYIRQGVTTLVCGNCGTSPTNIAEFFWRLGDGGTGPNIAVLIGHSSVRRQVLGERNVAPSPQQLSEMKRIVRDAMRAGAVGMSTGLRYSPGAFATTGEVIELAKELAPFGGFYATHMRDEGTQILEALDEAIHIGKEAGVAVHVSHHKISSVSVFGLTRLTLARIDQLRDAGFDITLDQYPYGAGSGSMTLYAPQASLSGGLDAFRRRAADPKQRAQIVAGIEELLVRKIYEAGQDPTDADHTAVALARIQVARSPHDTTLEGQHLAQILRSRMRDVSLRNGAELLIELISHDVLGINHTLDVRPDGDVDRVMTHPLTCVASDGGVFQFGTGNPHPRSYGCYPRVLGHFVRDRKLLSMEQAIHKMTSLPAQRLGWTNRGLLKPGQWADVVVFNPETISDKANFVEPHQYSTGVEHVIVGGKIALRSGEMTGALPGRPIGNVGGTTNQR